jgi:hypothetical protein
MLQRCKDKKKNLRKFPPEITGKPKTKCSAVASMLVRNINVDCTAAKIIKRSGRPAECTG